MIGRVRGAIGLCRRRPRASRRRQRAEARPSSRKLPGRCARERRGVNELPKAPRRQPASQPPASLDGHREDARICLKMPPDDRIFVLFCFADATNVSMILGTKGPLAWLPVREASLAAQRRSLHRTTDPCDRTRSGCPFRTQPFVRDARCGQVGIGGNPPATAVGGPDERQCVIRAVPGSGATY